MRPEVSKRRIKLGLLFLGRKRPGFDMDWGADMEVKVRDADGGIGALVRLIMAHRLFLSLQLTIAS